MLNLSHRSMVRSYRILLALILCAAYLGHTAHPAQAAVDPTNNALNLAIAMSVEPALIRAASFVTQPPATNGFSTAIVDQTVGGFPRHGGSFVAMSTGNSASILPGTGYPGTNLAGTVHRGNSDYDVTTLKIDLNVPVSRNCVAFDVQFMSLETPLSVGTVFNDAFIAEWDVSNWTTNNGIINAPNNFAYDSRGRMLSVSGTGQTMMTSNAAGTNFMPGGATPITRVYKTVAPGNYSLYLSIFDQGDYGTDSAVFLDNLLIYQQSGGNCTPPAPLLPDTVGVYYNGTFYLRGSNTSGVADIATTFGSANFRPVVGDWNGDGVDTIGVFDPQTATFHLRDANTPGAPNYVFMFGNPNDLPVAGHWDNTMTGSGVGVFRPSNGMFYLKRSLSSGPSDYAIVLGVVPNYAVTNLFSGDWDGNGVDAIGIVNSSTYPNVHLTNSVTSGTFHVDFVQFAQAPFSGSPYDSFVAGDWFGQGISTVGTLNNGIVALTTSLNYYPQYASFNYGPNSFQAVLVAGKWGIPSSTPPVVTALYPGEIEDIPARRDLNRRSALWNILVSPAQGADPNTQITGGGAD